MPDVHDPDEAERLEAEHHDAYHSRREFLERTAAVAGLAGLGLTLSPDTVLAEATRRGTRALPSGRNLPIDTFVVLMMENRSFDHYLGWLPGADGRQAGLTFRDKQGKVHHTHRLAPDFQGLAYLDPDHSWEGGRTQLDGGRNDGFLQSDSDVFSIGYYTKPDLPFIPHAAQAFTTYDRFFCSLLGSTYPNRYYMHSAQSFGRKDNGFPFLKADSPLGLPDQTIFSALAQKGVSSRYFYSDIPVAALWGVPGLARSGPVQEYYERCAAGTLPAVSFVDPSFNGEEAGTSGDEHPHGDVRVGQAFMADVVHAFMRSPQWKRGALFIVYDEWGGFFDHVRPPRVPDVRSSRDVANDFGQMGFRIPAIAVSPWVRRGHVDHGVYGFESILKMIRYRYGLAPLTRRDQFARNIALSFDFAGKPKLDLPALPGPRRIMRGKPIGAQPAASEGQARLRGEPAAPPPERAKPHDLAELYSSGYLDRLGFDYVPATPARMFRHPSSMGLRP
ncbi:alkaline phosphatase family protein [Patulibacter defluvii]|uniref:alkaline phosphatase family protein n=1 Tax=Patulibacter defluvii TaxID=3095358 RepID=UPI002A76651D|nr:alkaline phosphatase family protein [Patulibacter sp. DM4]